MQGLYIHIPFCAQACHYCDFHFSTNFKVRSQMIEMICKEMHLQSSYLKSKKLDTIYFGGGTPSVLEANELEQIFNTIHDLFLIDPMAEITLEANPDDLSINKLNDFFALGVNRLSIGIQSFNDSHLKFLNRIHDAEGACLSVNNARKAGFENITIDLIYGIHSNSHDIWKSDLEKALSLEVPHISSYCLTIEPDTVFGNWVKKKILPEIEDEFAAEQFEILMDRMDEAGMEQYEISNFSLPGMISRHNSNYWTGGLYLGIGPSAHSYNGSSRQYNISNNPKYLQSLKDNIVPFEMEVLTPVEKFNEALLTGLRTKWGFDLKIFESEARIPDSFSREKLNDFIHSGHLNMESGIITLTRSGKFLADKITAELFAD